MPPVRPDTALGNITDAAGISNVDTTFHDTSMAAKMLAALPATGGAISSPNYAKIAFEPKTVNAEKAYLMAYGQEPPLAPQQPQLTVALTSGVAPAALEVTNGPLFVNPNQVRITDPTGVNTQVYTVTTAGTTRTHIVLTTPANANYSYPIGSSITAVATSTAAAGSYGFKCTYVTADGETNAGAQSALALIPVNTDQIVLLLGMGDVTIPSGVTSVKFYKVQGPGNQGLIGTVVSGSFVGGVAIFQTTGAAVGDNTNFAPSANTTVNSSTGGSIWRGREGSTAVAHAINKPWAIVATGDDMDRANQDWLYTPGGWDDAWLRAQWNNANALGWASGFGSSIFMGGRATQSWMTASYWALWCNAVAARSGITRAGDFYATTYCTAWQGTFVGTPPWVMDHTAQNWVRAGIWMSARHDVASAAPMMHFTSPNIMRSGEILYWDATGTSGLTATYNVDGGATQTINFTGSGTMKRISTGLTGLSAATHVINFLSNSLLTARGTLYVMGVCAYTTTAIPTTGIAFGWSGVYGGLFGTFADSAYGTDANHPNVSVTADCLSQWGGPTNAAVPYTWGYGFPTAPDLFVFDLPNDALSCDSNITGAGTPAPWQIGLGPSMYELKLGQLVEALRGGQSNPPASVLFHVIDGPRGFTSDVPGSPDGDLYSWPMYRDAIYRVARDYRCAVLNTNLRWQGEGPTKGFQNWGDDHPLDPGHQDIAYWLGQAA